MRKYSKILVALPAVLGILAVSCGTPSNVVYFQDIHSSTAQAQAYEYIRVRSGDKLSILVTTRDAQLTDLFNLPYVSRYLGQSASGRTYGNSQGLSGYTVETDGTINFPVVGKIEVAGLTREEIAGRVKEELEVRNLVKDPVVTVEFLNLTFTVLGEVKNPGRYSIDRDDITVLDAIGMAGDLTIYGERENVMVTRIENGSAVTYDLDFTSGEQLFASPAFMLKQGDVVYVSPNDARIRQSTVNGNNIRSTSFWISLASLAATICTVIISASK